MRTQRGRLRPLFLVLGAVSGVAWLASRWTDAVAVRGTSMAPTLLPGELLLVERWTFRRRPPRTGDVVLARDPRARDRELIKRVATVIDGAVELRGDGSATTDSRTFGRVPVSEVAWRVAVRYWPLGRIGPIPPTPPVVYEPDGGEPACTAFGDLVVGG
jgi:nickel-type superoxide dismutase maturation protease